MRAPQWIVKMRTFQGVGGHSRFGRKMMKGKWRTVHKCSSDTEALRLAREVMNRGGLAGAAFNAAKERALDLFIDRRIGFLDMASCVEAVLERFEGANGLLDIAMTLDNVRETDHLARRWVDETVIKRAG